MMNRENFLSSLQQDAPPEDISLYLKALWYDKKENWHMAHTISQDINDTDGSWIHAYLHRKEGDKSNAGYWYRLAGKPMPAYDLNREWEEMIESFLE